MITSLRLMREFEAGRKVADNMGDRATSPTGEPYQVVCGMGGEDDAREAFSRFAAGKTGVLYWRTLPELRDTEDGPSFYMRLFIATEEIVS